MVIFGLSLDRAVSNLLPAMTMVGGVGWGLVYPALMVWRERAARRSEAHLHSPDFEASAPVVEPVVGIFVLLAAVTWLMLSGYTSEGIGPILGYLVGMSFGLVAVAVAAVLIVRPIFVKKAEARAFDQYLEAGDFHLKKNPKRARRMYDRALAAAKGDAQLEKAARSLRDATTREAEELKSKGLHDQAEKLIESSRQKPGMGYLSGWGTIAREDAPPQEDVAVISAKDVLAQQSPPKLLDFGSVKIAAEGPTPVDPDARAASQRAQILERRNRMREALEELVAADLPATPTVAREAAKEYIASGMLRSADVIFDALGEEQIPEFYKALAVELERSNNGNPAPDACLRLGKKLSQLNELKAAAQITCRGALSSEAGQADRVQLGQLAMELCALVGAEPPPDLLEVLGHMEAAALAYESDNRPADAKRCWYKLADKLLANGSAKQFTPVLSKLFLLDDKALDDKYFGPLAEQVINSGSTSPSSMKILSAYRRRHPGDRKVSRRLFEVYLAGGKLEEALVELDALSKHNDSTTQLLEDFQQLASKYPQSFEVRIRLVGAQLRVGKVKDAVKEVTELMALPESQQRPHELVKLLDSLFEWGHSDPELKKEAALLKLSTGDRDGALAMLETYVLGGGRDPEAIQHVEQTLRESLVDRAGSPNHEAHMRLARFMLHRGAPEEAIPLLEVCRRSSTYAFEAEILLARAHLAASNPRSAIDYLRDAIAGRGLSETPELHFELARALEELGHLAQAQKIDDALDMAMPGFRKEYLAERLVFEKADTQWVPPIAYGEEGHGDTNPNVEPMSGPASIAADLRDPTLLGEDTGIDPIQPVVIETPKVETMDLSEVLAPRYKLKKRVGSGGMGDVHMAEDLVLGRKVAIKVLRRTLATDLFLAKFKDEARIVAQLTHPGIVQVYDIGHRAEWAYIVMEYVAGPNLATLVSAATPPARSQLMHIMSDVADAMAYAHRRGVIHRDLKPANILVSTEGVAKVTDFGIAHVLQGDGKDETAFSAAGMQVGTVNYMAPEQIRGKKVDARTDIYLLGTTLYYCLSGKYPFSGDAIVIQKLKSDPTPIENYVTNISRELAAFVMKCLARSPDDRWQTMEEVGQKLRRLPDALAEARTELL
jgi:predicted Zn-dependent protease